MTIADRLYNQDTPTTDLIRQIEEAITGTGYTLSRWQTSSKRSAVVVTITYAVHRGPRRDQARRQSDVLMLVVINQLEGKTTRCESYRQLKWLWNCIERHFKKETPA